MPRSPNGSGRGSPGLCTGFLPVLGMPLHNWVFGHALVLFSNNANDPHLLVMPPSAYLAAVRDLLSLDFSGLGRVLRTERELAERAGGILLDDPA